MFLNHAYHAQGSELSYVFQTSGPDQAPKQFLVSILKHTAYVENVKKLATMF